MNNSKRFVWLAFSITFPVIAGSFIEEPKNGGEIGVIDGTKLLVFAICEIVFISLTVSEFIKTWIAEIHQRELRLKAERDEDIKRWREEFFADLARYRQAQKTFDGESTSHEPEPPRLPLTPEVSPQT